MGYNEDPSPERTIMTKIEDIEYWAKKLQENNEEIAPFMTKMHNKPNSLAYEELYRLQHLIMQNGSFVRLLNERLAQADPITRKWYQFWKK